MVEIVGGRATGKTTRLLQECAAHGGILVTAHNKDYVLRMMKELDIQVPVISLWEFLSFNRLNHGKRYYVDEIDTLFRTLGIAGYTRSIEQE